MSGIEKGMLIAVSILLACHDQPSMAADVLNELGLHNADCSQLDDFDKENLTKVQGAKGGRIQLRGL